MAVSLSPLSSRFGFPFRFQAFLRISLRQELEELLNTGKLPAFGMNRQLALDFDAASPQLRALPDSFLGVVQRFVIRKGETGKRELLTDFAAELRESGFIRASLEKAGLGQSTSVSDGSVLAAPPATSLPQADGNRR